MRQPCNLKTFLRQRVSCVGLKPTVLFLGVCASVLILLTLSDTSCPADTALLTVSTKVLARRSIFRTTMPAWLPTTTYFTSLIKPPCVEAVEELVQRANVLEVCVPTSNLTCIRIQFSRVARRPEIRAELPVNSRTLAAFHPLILTPQMFHPRITQLTPPWLI